MDEASWAAARNDRIWRAAGECARSYPSIELVAISPEGGLHYEYREDVAEQKDFERCLDGRVRTILGAAPGRLAIPAGAPRRAVVPLEDRGGPAVIVVLVDGVESHLIVDTGATRTMLSPAFARRLGLAPSGDALPIRVRSIRVADLGVEDLDVGVYDGVADAPDLAGLLGQDFLKFFRVTLDPHAGRLVLEAP